MQFLEKMLRFDLLIGRIVVEINSNCLLHLYHAAIFTCQFQLVDWKKNKGRPEDSKTYINVLAVKV